MKTTSPTTTSSAKSRIRPLGAPVSSRIRPSTPPRYGVRLAAARTVAAAAVTGLVVTGCGGSPGRPAPTGSATPVVVGRPTSAAVPSTVLAAPRGGFDPAVSVTVGMAPTLTAEVARRGDQREYGLMARDRLAVGTGMLFLLPRLETGGFYMYGTRVPLSIAYVRAGRVVSTAEMVPCTSADPSRCPTYPPTAGYDSAVEAAGGFFPIHRVEPGQPVVVIGPTQPPQR